MSYQRSVFPTPLIANECSSSAFMQRMTGQGVSYTVGEFVNKYNEVCQLGVCLFTLDTWRLESIIIRL